jgi:hypothetical protein
VIRHRGTCEHPDCGRAWRENCEDCLREVTERHTAETGHPVGLSITSEESSNWEVLRLAQQARRLLATGRIGP